MPDNSETLLVLQAQAGDRDAFEALLECVGEPLFGYLLQLTGEREIARDLLQETLLTIYRKLLWLREPTSFRPWAYRIASRAARS